MSMGNCHQFNIPVHLADEVKNKQIKRNKAIVMVRGKCLPSRHIRFEEYDRIKQLFIKVGYQRDVTMFIFVLFLDEDVISTNTHHKSILPNIGSTLNIFAVIAYGKKTIF